MIFKAHKIKNQFGDDNTIPIYCLCSFCKGEKIRKDVDHYKAYAFDCEYFININNTDSLIEIRKKF